MIRMPATHQRLWTALRVIRRDVDAPGLALAAGTTRQRAMAFLNLLARAGYVQPGRSGIGPSWRLVRDTGSRAPKRTLAGLHDVNTNETHGLLHAGAALRLKIWAAMRSVPTPFTVADLVAASGAPAHSVQIYVQLLHRAGMIDLAAWGNGRTGKANAYLWTIAPGPLAPERVTYPSGRDVVIDPNSKIEWPIARRRRGLAGSRSQTQPALAGSELAA